MKKSVFTLLVLLVCILSPIQAYEYFTIYFSDGTKSEAFYATDVDSICYSKLSLDSIACDDWQVQEIYTCDSVYRYPLALIDSLSFKDVDINKVAEDIAKATDIIVPLYSQYNSPLSLSQHMSEILEVENVEDAWTDNQGLYVKIKDYGVMSFLYPPSFKGSTNKSRHASRRSIDKNHQNGHSHGFAGKVCIYNQTDKDESEGREWAQVVYEELREMYDQIGIPCATYIDLRPDFFKTDIFNYDQIFLITHGEYDGKLHWLYTNEELLCTYKNNWVSSTTAWINFLRKHPIYSPNHLGIGTLIEIRNGKPCLVFYTKISEKFISSSVNRFKNPNNTMIFNVACQSLSKNDNMGNAFIEKGANCYLGYDDTNGIGVIGGDCFFTYLLNASCGQSAFEFIPSEWKEEDVVDSRRGIEYHPRLKQILNKSNKAFDLCIMHTETCPAEKEEDTGMIKLKGQIKTLNNADIVNDYQYGFLISNDSTMTQADTIKVKEKDVKYNSETYYMNWEKTLDADSLQSDTTYYYCAYMYDGYSYCYGEVKEIAAAEPYVVVNNDTLTFYYDNKKEERAGKAYKIENYYDKIYQVSDDSCKWVYNYPQWSNDSIRDSIKYAVFDVSFKNYKPNSTAYWFYRLWELSSIEHLDYLNTANVTDMSGMFRGCYSLTSLDVSSFNTANVTRMYHMFYFCSSLTSLDVSNFNTSNVTDMSCMFGECQSLKSLDLSNFNTANVTDMSGMFGFFNGRSSLTSLDVSNFNTANVTDMGGMFEGCYSLKSLDVSSFNTANVTLMWGMFAGCSSLTSLDVSSFNTTNVTEMSSMFRDCSGLTSLDVSNFNTANVTGMFQMFGWCSSLTSLDLSSFNTANVTDMDRMFPGCSSLMSLNLNSFNTANVTNMEDMFYNCSSLTSLNLNSFNTANVTNMEDMFHNCSSLTSLDLSSFNTANVTNMEDMFYNCSSLTSLDIRNFVIKDGVEIRMIFSGCSALERIDARNMVIEGCQGAGLFSRAYGSTVFASLKSINMSNADTSKATDMSNMFSGCSSLTSLDVSNFNTANVTKMKYMFSGCCSLTNLDLSSFNTANVTDMYNMEGMFSGCSSLKTIYAGDWNSNRSRGEENDMFSGCSNLVGGKGTKIGENYGRDEKGRDYSYKCWDDGRAANIDRGKDNPGLFTAK